MFQFSLVMLLLVWCAHLRGPRFRYVSFFWFLISWLPKELPWIFAAVQIVVVVIFSYTANTIEAKEFLGIIISIGTVYFWLRLHRLTFTAGAIFQNALQKTLGKNYESQMRTDVGIASPSVLKKWHWLLPFSFKRKGVECLQNIAYGPMPRHQLDIYRPCANAEIKNTTGKNSHPVLLHVHGGAWILGHKKQQAQPLLNYLAQNGWICVDINYRRAPQHRFPNCVIDVKMAIAWLKENIAAYGGNPSFIAITGGSAGGHLCSLAALTANRPEFQPGFEEKDTSVQAAVPVYGMYDFTNGERDGRTMQNFMAKYVMPMGFEEDALFWRNLSPVHCVTENNPPMFVIHGDTDCVVAVEQARDLVNGLREKSKAPVVYAELTGAQHAYDIFHSVRTKFHIEAVGKFLHHCYGSHSNK